MSATGGSSGGGDRSGSDRIEVLRNEAREVLDAQLRTLRDTDRKAMATARVDGLILGLLLSAGSIADAPETALNPWLFAGTGFILGSLVVAVVTYSVDRPSYGVNPAYLDVAVESKQSQQGVESDLLAGYAEWIRDNADEISSNGTYLLVAQGLLVLGLSSVTVGIYRAI